MRQLAVEMDRITAGRIVSIPELGLRATGNVGDSR